MAYRFFLLIMGLTLFSALPQEKVTISGIRSAYESFEYREVINLSASFLAEADSSEMKKVNEVLLMKAVSHYALAEEAMTRRCFIDMLKNDKDARLDSAAVSPKIVDLFDRIKADFLEMLPESRSQGTIVLPEGGQNKPEPQKDYSGELTLVRQQYDIYRSSVIRSLLLPGLGHLHLGEKTYGYILTGLAVVTAGTAAYYIMDTGIKENKYLAETQESTIRAAYSEYNSAYKLRNGFLTAFGLIWIYAQSDILLFNNSLYLSPDIQTVNNRFAGLGINFSLAF